MAGLREGGNEPAGSLKAIFEKVLFSFETEQREDPNATTETWNAREENWLVGRRTASRVDPDSKRGRLIFTESSLRGVRRGRKGMKRNHMAPRERVESALATSPEADPHIQSAVTRMDLNEVLTTKKGSTQTLTDFVVTKLEIQHCSKDIIRCVEKVVRTFRKDMRVTRGKDDEGDEEQLQLEEEEEEEEEEEGEEEEEKEEGR
ncbi:hypothetical protein ANN_23390 [Periplaneta americana]|uniref:Uncharacterized protein n=1 Tax=Periplaneta americana TaxID=6978 RepID=A0ABQ8SKY7_PERAM|nr:hypothetical protein ANN_23390 [Periplaneta americana]